MRGERSREIETYGSICAFTELKIRRILVSEDSRPDNEGKGIPFPAAGRSWAAESCPFFVELWKPVAPMVWV